jgi:Fusaric acid resistance protein-like
MLSGKRAARAGGQLTVPDLADWIAGLRLACAFLLPVAAGLMTGHTLTGLFAGIGGFMVANADLGESYGQRLRLMVPATAAIAGLTAVGMLAGAAGLAAVPLGALILLLGGLAASLGREAAVLGTFLSFAYVIGVGLAASPQLPVSAVTVPMLAGGAYAMTLSAISVTVLGHKPDQAPEPWHGLLARARSRTDASLVRHAAALAIAGGTSLAVVPFTHQSNGAWLVTGALIVLKPGYPDTLRAALLRTVGTVAGALFAGVIAAATSQPWVLLSVALVLTCAAEAVIRHSFGWFALLITPLSILLTNILVPGNWQIAAVRVADVAAGSVIAVTTATLLRPRKAASHADQPAMHRSAEERTRHRERLTAGLCAVINRASRGWPPRLRRSTVVLTCIFIQRRPRDEHPHLPRSALPPCAEAGAAVRLRQPRTQTAERWWGRKPLPRLAPSTAGR